MRFWESLIPVVNVNVLLKDCPGAVDCAQLFGCSSKAVAVVAAIRNTQSKVMIPFILFFASVLKFLLGQGKPKRPRITQTSSTIIAIFTGLLIALATLVIK